MSESEVTQEIFEASEHNDGAFVGQNNEEGYEFLLDTYEIKEPEIDYDLPSEPGFPVDGAKHRALLDAAYGAVENDIDLTAIALSETNGHISVVEPDHEYGEVNIEVHGFDEEFSEGILGTLDDIRRGNVDYLRSDDAGKEEERKYNIMIDAAKTDRNMAKRKKHLEETDAPEDILEDLENDRKRQEGIVNMAYYFGESFNDTPYSDTPAEDGNGLPLVEIENMEDIEQIAEVMSYNAITLSENPPVKSAP